MPYFNRLMSVFDASILPQAQRFDDVLGCAGARGQQQEAEGEAGHGVTTRRPHQHTGPSSVSWIARQNQPSPSGR
jgi:hypothetical protein